MTLGPFQSSTDTEPVGLRLALDHLATQTDWYQAYIVSDSQAALLQLGGISWRRIRASIWDVKLSGICPPPCRAPSGVVVGPWPCKH